jgi:hypothetical protein
MMTAEYSSINTLFYLKYADVAQEVEHILGKDEVSGSSPDISSSEKSP